MDVDGLDRNGGEIGCGGRAALEGVDGQRGEGVELALQHLTLLHEESGALLLRAQRATERIELASMRRLSTELSWSRSWFAMSGAAGAAALLSPASAGAPTDEVRWTKTKAAATARQDHHLGPMRLNIQFIAGSALRRRHVELDGHPVAAGAHDLDRAHDAVLGDRADLGPPS